MSTACDDLWEVANPALKDLVAYEPGLPIEEVARELGFAPEEVIKLASNENPLGPSPKALIAMKEAAERAHFYPDGGGYRLREAIAGKFGVEMGQVVLGNGSNEIIELMGHAFLKPGDEVVVAEHAFVVYKLMATLFGAETIEVPDPNFVHDLDAMLAAITPKTKEVFITNPNNPTGTMVFEEALDRFMEKVPPHVVVVFDEAYYEFLDNPPNTLKYVEEGKRVVVLRTFSKIQGLASLRIGYGMGHPEVMALLQKARQPFNANALAQAGALAGLLDQEHQDKTKALNDEGKDFLEKSFAELGLEYVPSYANFVLVKVGDNGAAGDRLFEDLMKQGIIVRAMRSYKLPDWVRVSVGTMEQNERFVQALQAWRGIEK